MLGLLRTAPTFDNSAGFDDIDEDNNAAYQFPDGRPRGYRGLSAAGTSIYDNPYWTSFNNPLQDKVNRVIGNFSVSYDPTSWLNFTWRPGLDFYSDFRKQYFAIYSATLSGGQVFEDQYFSKRWNSDLLATIKHDITDQIGMNFSVGYNIREFRLDRLYSQGDGLVIPNFYDLSNASSVRSEATNDISRNQGFFGVLDMDYNDWLYISGTIRNEKDLSLPEGNNTYWYYSAGGSVVLTEALGITNNPALSFAKIRGSYGRVGLGTFAYSTATYFEQGDYADGWTNGINFPFRGTSAFTFSDVLGNPNLRPEFRDSWEIGADLRFFRNRVGLDVTYYNSVSKDIILSVPITASSGFQNIIQNAAQLSNKGFEIVLSATPVRTKNLSWDMMVNFTRNVNNVDQLAEGVDQVFLGGFLGASTRAVVDVPYGSIFGFGFYKDASGATVIDGREFLPNGDANPDYLFPIADPNEKAFNSALPDYTIGFRNSISFKGITVSALLDIKQGGYVWNGTKGALYYFGTHQETAERRNTREVFEGNLAVFDAEGNLVLTDHDNNPSTPDIPQTSGANNQDVLVTQGNWLSTGNGNGFFGSNTEDFIEEASWVRLRDVSISYSLPKNLLSKAKISHLTLTLSGRNLWLNTPYTGIDPETNLYGASNAQGLDYFNMPGTKSYTIGLQVGF
jgi:outer membrane receptor protein involved in Fe transport